MNCFKKRHHNIRVGSKGSHCTIPPKYATVGDHTACQPSSSWGPRIYRHKMCHPFPPTCHVTIYVCCHYGYNNISQIAHQLLDTHSWPNWRHVHWANYLRTGLSTGCGQRLDDVTRPHVNTNGEKMIWRTALCCMASRSVVVYAEFLCNCSR